MKVIKTYDDIVDDYAERFLDVDADIESYSIIKGHNISVIDTKGQEMIIDEDFLCDMYGDMCGGGAEWCFGGAVLFETYNDRDIHCQQV